MGKVATEDFVRKYTVSLFERVEKLEKDNKKIKVGLGTLLLTEQPDPPPAAEPRYAVPCRVRSGTTGNEYEITDVTFEPYVNTEGGTYYYWSGKVRSIREDRISEVVREGPPGEECVCPERKREEGWNTFSAKWSEDPEESGWYYYSINGNIGITFIETPDCPPLHCNRRQLRVGEELRFCGPIPLPEGFKYKDGAVVKMD